MLSLLWLFVQFCYGQDPLDGLYYKKKADTSYMYHILEENVIESEFSGNATANNGLRHLIEGPSKPYTTIEFTILRLKPSDDPKDLLDYENNPIVMSGTAMNQYDSKSFYDFLSTNSTTKSQFEKLNQTEKDYWNDVHFVFQSWCEDPVCPPDESILYKVRYVRIYCLVFCIASMCSVRSEIQRRSHNGHSSRWKQYRGSS